MNPFFSFDDDEFFGDLLLMGAASGCGSVVQETATGNPLTFQTDIARPLKSLLIPFTPQQSGTGDPSPSNIRSILPWNGLTVDHISENLWKNNEKQSFTRYIKITLSQTLPAGTYTFTATVESETTGTECAVGFSKGNNNVIAIVKLPKSGRHSATFTVNDTVDTVYMYADIDYAPSAGLTATYSGILIEAGTKAPTDTDIVFPALGKNLFNKNSVIRKDGYTIGYDGLPSESQTSGYTENFIPVEPSTDYTISGNGVRVPIYYDKEKNFITRPAGQDLPFTFNTPANCYYVRLQYLIASVNFDNLQLEKGSSASAYEPYISVYGGEHEAVSGRLMDGWGIVDLGTFTYDIEPTADGHSFFVCYNAIPGAKKVGNNTLSSYLCGIYKTVKGTEIYFGLSGDYAISMVDSESPGIRIRDDRYETATELKTALTGVMLAYELATPQEIQLTPAQITALDGDNTIWSDADGQMTAVYLKKG